MVAMAFSLANFSWLSCSICIGSKVSVKTARDRKTQRFAHCSPITSTQGAADISLGQGLQLQGSFTDSSVSAAALHA